MKCKRGATIVEVGLALAILCIVLIGVLNAVGSGARTMLTGAIATTVESGAREALDRIHPRLEMAALSTISPPGIVAPASTPFIEYRRVVGYAGGAAILSNTERIEFQYSPTDPNDGLDNDGNGLVDDGRVVWTQNLGLAGERSIVICNWVPEFQAGEIPGNTLDENGNGLTDEAGLCFTSDGRTIIARLTLSRPVSATGMLIERSVQKVIVLRVAGP